VDPLIREFLRGDARARDALVSRYSPIAESASRRYPALDPDDAFSEALLVIHRKLPELDWGNNPTAYLTNAINDWLRSKERDARRRQGKEGPSLDAPIGEDGATVGDLIASDFPNPVRLAELAEDVDPYLPRLCKRQRRVFILNKAAQMGVMAIAYREGRSQAEVKASLRGAERKIGRLREAVGLPNSEEGKLRNSVEVPSVKPRRYGIRWECVMDPMTREQLGRLSMRFKCSEAEAVRRLITERFAESHDDETGMVEREGA
jgi:RNA polymerase sigma factor (sigma-70 family)